MPTTVANIITGTPATDFETEKNQFNLFNWKDGEKEKILLINRMISVMQTFNQAIQVKKLIEEFIQFLKNKNYGSIPERDSAEYRPISFITGSYGNKIADISDPEKDYGDTIYRLRHFLGINSFVKEYCNQTVQQIVHKRIKKFVEEQLLLPHNNSSKYVLEGFFKKGFENEVLDFLETKSNEPCESFEKHVTVYNIYHSFLEGYHSTTGPIRLRIDTLKEKFKNNTDEILSQMRTFLDTAISSNKSWDEISTIQKSLRVETFAFCKIQLDHLSFESLSKRNYTGLKIEKSQQALLNLMNCLRQETILMENIIDADAEKLLVISAKIPTHLSHLNKMVMERAKELTA